MALSLKQGRLGLQFVCICDSCKKTCHETVWDENEHVVLAAMERANKRAIEKFSVYFTRTGKVFCRDCYEKIQAANIEKARILNGG